MSLESLKLTKPLLHAMAASGFEKPLPMQAKALSRISGGQEIVGIGPEGIGKSSTIVLSVLSRLKYAHESAPRALVMCPDKDRVAALMQLFQQLTPPLTLRILAVHAGGGIEGQKEAIGEGIDIIIGTPDRILALYLKNALNLNKLQQFIVDDAELVVKQGLQSPIHQIALSLPKCQRLAFSEVMHEKLQRLLDGFMFSPSVIEVQEESEQTINTIPLFLYQTPNYKTKQNLANLLMSDMATYTKVAIFANTKITAQNIYKSLAKRYAGEVVLLKPPVYDQQGVQSMSEFKSRTDLRILVVSNETEQFMKLDDLSHLIHLDLPSNKDLVVQRIAESNFDNRPLPTSFIFATDIELPMVKKIELTIGSIMEVLPFPAGLIVEGSRSNKKIQEGEALLAEKSKVSNQGAFHEKKPSNAKDYNWGWKEKNKLFGKKYKKHKH